MRSRALAMVRGETEPRSRSVRFLCVAAACAAVLGVSSCGGDSDEISSEQAAEGKAVLVVADQLKEAYTRKDPAAICALIDPQGLKKQFKSEKGCRKQLTAALTQAGAQLSAENFDFDSVTVDGGSAVATQKEGPGNEVYFKKVKGKWYVDVNPQAGSSPDVTGTE